MSMKILVGGDIIAKVNIVDTWSACAEGVVADLSLDGSDENEGDGEEDDAITVSSKTQNSARNSQPQAFYSQLYT